jgi:hypothetical protein
VGPSVRLSRVLALVGGLALVAAFFMPWFGSQGLLLSGQFLHTFLTNASLADLRRFLPTSSPTEVQLLRVLVDVFPVCGAIAAAAALIGSLYPPLLVVANVVLGLSGLVPLLAWAGGVTRLPQGSSPEIGLWLIALGAVAILVGLGLELVFRPRPPAPSTHDE